MMVSGIVGEATVNVKCDPEYVPVAQQILGMMHTEALNGRPVRPGMVIQFGWSQFTLQLKSGKLTLFEPDFDHDPLTQLRDNIDCTIDVYLAQQSLIKEMGLSGWQPANCFEQIMAAHGCLTEPRIIAKHYSDPKGNTGWVIFRREDQTPLTLDTFSKQYGNLPVWQLLHVRPTLLRYLALPPGYTVFLDADKPEQIINAQDEIWR